MAKIRFRTVYFIQGELTRLIKIGVSDVPAVRMAQLQSGSPDRLVLIGSMRCERFGALEVELHQLFAEHRRHGEWFFPAAELLAFIERGKPPEAPADAPRPRTTPVRRRFTDSEIADIERRLSLRHELKDIARDYGVGPGKIGTVRWNWVMKYRLPDEEAIPA